MNARYWLVFFAVAALLVAGCGDSNELSQQSAPTTVSSESTPAVAPEPSPTPEFVHRTRVQYGLSEYYGETSLEERILYSDVVARVELITFVTSVHPYVDLGDRGYNYMPVFEFKLRVIEYLKGSGPSKITALAHTADDATATEAESTTLVAELAAERDTTWDDRQAIVFLDESADDVSATSAADVFWLGWITYRDSEVYSIHSPWAKVWLPAAAAPADSGGGDGSRSPSDTSTMEFLLAPPPSSGASGRSGGGRVSQQQQSTPTITLADLRTKISAVEGQVSAAGGTDEARECVQGAYEAARSLEYKGDRARRTVQRSTDSGLAAGTIVHESEPRMIGLPPDRMGRYWLEGQDTNLFAVSTHDPVPTIIWGKGNPDAIFYKRRMSTARPLSAGEYQVYWNAMWAGRLICNLYFEAERNLEDNRITVTAPSGTAYEAIFDPTTVGGAVQADSMLKPYTAPGADTATISSVSWKSGTLKIGMDPVTAHAEHSIDFIDVDGDVVLSLRLSDAAVDAVAGTLSWRVTEPPWDAGDEMMLRIRGGPP